MEGISLNDVKPEHLTGFYKELYTFLSKDLPSDYAVIATIKMALLYSGAHPYFPKIESAIRLLRDAQIRAEYTGKNDRALADKFNLTTSHLRVIATRKPE